MDALSIGTLLVGIGTIGTVVVMIFSPRTKDANRIAAAAVQQTERQNDLDVMETTITTLRSNLADAQIETNQLRSDLREARTETQKLRNETTTALANVAVLSEHIRRHVPETVPFPHLRTVSGV